MQKAKKKKKAKSKAKDSESNARASLVALERQMRNSGDASKQQYASILRQHMYAPEETVIPSAGKVARGKAKPSSPSTAARNSVVGRRKKAKR